MKIAKRNRWIVTSAVTLALVLGGVAISQSRGGVDTSRIPDILLEKLHSGVSVERFVAQLADQIRTMDIENDGLDQGDIDLARQQAWAQARAQSVSQILGHDLDGDFRVSRAELSRSVRADEPGRTRQVASLIERFDSNGDEVVIIEEAALAARNPSARENLNSLLALDPNRDGRLTSREARDMAFAAFDIVDTDGDGALSSDEYAAVAQQIQEAQLTRQAASCALPAAPAGARILAYGGYESTALSSVAVGGEAMETNFIDVFIEPGHQPLYLVLTSYESMIWRFQGATDRVRQAVIGSAQGAFPASPGPRSQGGKRGERSGRVAPSFADLPDNRVSAAGALGLPRDKVTIAPIDCLPYFKDPGDRGSRLLSAGLRRAVGRGPDESFGTYSARRVLLPSGRIERGESEVAPVPRGFDAESWKEARRFWRGGLVPVDPRRVVAAAHVAPYRVLPSQMGISQLIGAGALQPVAGGYRIVRPIPHFPPSMGGAHSVTLILAPGVPMPTGDPLHSCIISEDSGTRQGARCGLGS